MTLTTKALPLSVLHAIAYQQYGWRSRFLIPKLSIQLGLVLAWSEA